VRIVALALIGIALAISPAEDAKRKAREPVRPGDFAIEYHWRAGSMPPPHHYEFVVVIRAGGEGEVVMVPDYPAPGVPRWTEVFVVRPDEMDRLYATITGHDLFTRVWQRPKQQRIGGSRRSLAATANGKKMTLEDYVVEEQAKAASAIFEAVEAAVPQRVWDTLIARRAEYVESHERR
jgi:hypothetical protein